MTTLAQPTSVVKDWYTYPATPKADESASDGPDLAHRWGYEDSIEGVDARMTEYFPIGSPAWKSYKAGYKAGLIVRKQTAPPSELDEIEFMALALNTLRTDDDEEPAPSSQWLPFSEDDLDAIEEEKIGAAFSIAPYTF